MVEEEIQVFRYIGSLMWKLSAAERFLEMGHDCSHEHVLT